MRRTCEGRGTFGWGVAVAVVALACALASPASAADAQADTGWSWSVTPYVWLPSINGTFNYAVPPQNGGSNGSVSASSGPNNYLSNLNFAAMLAGEARRDRLTFVGDFINLNLSDNKAKLRNFNGPGGIVVIPVTFAAQTHISGTIAEGGAGWTLSRGSAGNLDVLLGVRYAGVTSSLAWQITGPFNIFNPNGSVSSKVNLTDAIGGVRGRLNLGGHWYLPYYLDGGAGGSQFTWQGVGGFAYALNKNTSLQVVHRTLHYTTGSSALQNISFSGPALAATFRF
ncbi:MAG: hypothetical protein JO359_14855 [Candidatus Eremiobacteraeota bacterium]|nr:hypothetical protein [Candidatus Eremiobacteraeota bacterium]